MRYWPLSLLRTSPLLPHACAPELDNLYYTVKMSPFTLNACGMVVQNTKALTASNMIAMEGDKSTTPKLIYVTRPTEAEWKRLERGVVVEINNRGCDWIFLVDSLH